MTDKQASEKDGLHDDDPTLSNTDMERDKSESESSVEAEGRRVSRHKLSRTPPQRRGSVPDRATVSHDNSSISSGQQDGDEEGERRSKRKREEGRNKESGKELVIPLDSSPRVNQVNRILRKVKAECKIIATMAKERNTKKEIKEASATLTQLISQLTTNEMQG